MKKYLSLPVLFLLMLCRSAFGHIVVPRKPIEVNAAGDTDTVDLQFYGIGIPDTRKFKITQPFLPSQPAKARAWAYH